MRLARLDFGGRGRPIVILHGLFVFTRSGAGTAWTPSLCCWDTPCGVLWVLVPRLPDARPWQFFMTNIERGPGAYRWAANAAALTFSACSRGLMRSSFRKRTAGCTPAPRKPSGKSYGASCRSCSALHLGSLE